MIKSSTSSPSTSPALLTDEPEYSLRSTPFITNPLLPSRSDSYSTGSNVPVDKARGDTDSMVAAPPTPRLLLTVEAGTLAFDRNRRPAGLCRFIRILASLASCSRLARS